MNRGRGGVGREGNWSMLTWPHRNFGGLTVSISLNLGGPGWGSLCLSLSFLFSYLHRYFMHISSLYFWRCLECWEGGAYSGGSKRCPQHAFISVSRWRITRAYSAKYDEAYFRQGKRSVSFQFYAAHTKYEVLRTCGDMVVPFPATARSSQLSRQKLLFVQPRNYVGSFFVHFLLIIIPFFFFFSLFYACLSQANE